VIENWYDIPVILIGCALGSWLGNLLALWIKRKLGWVE